MKDDAANLPAIILTDPEIEAAAGTLCIDDIVDIFNFKKREAYDRCTKTEQREMEISILTGRIIAADLQKRYPNIFHPENIEVNEEVRDCMVRSMAYLLMCKWARGYDRAVKDVNKAIKRDFPRKKKKKKGR